MAGVVQVVRWRVVAVVAAVTVLAAGAALAPRLLADDPPSAAPGQDCVADADVPLADLADLADVADARWVRFCPLADEGRGELLRHPQGVVTGELAAGTAGTLWETQVDRPLCGAFDAPLAGPTGRFRIEVGLPDGRIADLEGDTGCSTRDLVLFSQLETTLLVDASAAAGAPTPLDPTTCPGRLTTAETNDDGASAGQLVERAEHDALATVPLLPMLAATAEVCAYTGRAGSLTLLDQWRAGPRQAEAIRSTATLAHDRGARTMCDIDPGRTSYLVVLADATGTARTITVDNSECGALDAAVGTPAVSTYLGLARERLDRTIERSRP